MNIPRASDAYADPKVRFVGRAGEFFGIWIVNILLSLVTVGIYSAWAKVRTRQYFYGNTRLGGAAFDYLARPTQILKGRLIAVAVLIVYSVVSETVPVTEPWLTLSLLLFLPWVITRALAFNARMTAHRGLRFNFHGNYWGALFGYLLLPALGVASLGLLLPVGAWFRANYIVSNSVYGVTRFSQEQSLLAFYGAYARGALLLLVLLAPTLGGAAALYGPGLLDDLLLAPAYIAQLETPDAETTTDDDDDQPATTPPEADAEPLLDEAQQARVERLFATLLVLFYVLFALFAVVWIHIRTAVTNLTWDGARLGPLAIDLRLRFGYMLWLKTSNLFAIVLSFGLAIPWTHIRNARYVASRLQVFGLEEVNTLVGAEREAGSVIGEELGEAFDVDLGF